MASIERHSRDGQTRRYARHRDPTSVQLLKVFTRNVDAERYLTPVDASEIAGTYIGPKRAARHVHLTDDDLPLTKSVAGYRMCTETASSDL